MGSPAESAAARARVLAPSRRRRARPPAGTVRRDSCRICSSRDDGGRRVTALVAAPSSPYKGLAPFEDSELDALLFFGRERDSEIIASNLLASKLTLLYGPSGVGKSSILRAAVARRLRVLEPDAVVAVV